MTTRRRFLQHSCCCLGYLYCGNFAHSDSSNGYSGCFLSASEFRSQVKGFSTKANDETQAILDDLDTKTDDRNLNHAIGVTLTRLSKLFEVHPEFGFYDDEDSPNAFATETSVTPNTNGTVAFGYNLLQRQITEHPDGVSIMGILAHEFGHVVQYQRSLRDELMEGKHTVRLVELHADFLAGFYAGHRRLEYDMDTNGLGDAFLAIGDFNSKDTQHHGTPKERLSALTEGFKLGKEDQYTISDAVKTGIRVVREI